MVACLRPGGWLVDEDANWGTAGAPVDPAHPRYDDYERVWRDGDWWAARGYDKVFGQKLPVLFERCGLEDVRCEASTEVVRGGSPWARWWIPTLEVINELGGGDEASRRDVEVMTAALADPTVWLRTGGAARLLGPERRRRLVACRVGLAGEGEVGDAAGGGDRLDVVVVLEALQAVPDADAAAEHDRDLDEMHVVDEPGGEEVADDGGAATDPHVLAAGGFTGGLERLRRGGVEEVEGGAALHLDRGPAGGG